MTKGDRERRRAPRHAVEGLSGTLRLVSKAEVLNISLVGMAVRTSTHLRVGQKCDVQLAHGATTVRFPSSVVWAHLVGLGNPQESGTGPAYEVGFEFHDMLTEQARDLLKLLGETAVVSLEARVAGRFEPSAGEAAEVAASAELLVRKLSTSGLLAETEVGPEPGQELDLVLELGTVPFACRGRVAYLEDPEPQGDAPADGSRTRVGIEFLGLDGTARRTLESFIAEQLG